MAILIRTYITLLGCQAGAAAQQRIADRDGSIFLEGPGAQEARLTDSGRDFDARLTPDGNAVLFARSDLHDMFRSSIYEIELPARRESLVFGGPVTYRGTQVAYLGEPQIDPASHTLFVLARISVAGGAVFAIDPANPAGRYVADASGYEIILSGEHAGDLLLAQRKVSILGTIYEVYWLYSQDGKDLGMAGPGDMDVSTLVSPSPQGESPGSATGSATTTSPGVTRQDGGGVPLRVEPGVMAAKLDHYVAPQYPESAQAIPAFQRTVRLAVTVSAAGSVSDVRLVSGHPLLAQPAMAAVRKWTYRTTVVSGRQVPVVTTVDVRFAP